MTEHNEGQRARAVFSAERAKAFIDAIVAIALTLLILPLMESVGEAASGNLDTVQWWNENGGALFAFILSFVVIANFWMSHHRQFAAVTHVTNGLLWLMMAWALTIVWLPIATAVVGQLDTDTLQKVLYIGSMLLTSGLTLVIQLYLRAHPHLHELAPERVETGLRVDVILSVLFAVALVLSIVVPGVDYSAMFVLLLTAPLMWLSTKRRRSRTR